MLPLALQTIAERQAGIDVQRAVADRLVAKHPGFRIENYQGDSIPIRTSSAHPDLPGLLVQFGGRIQTDRMFAVSETALDALLAAVTAPLS